MLSHDPGPRLRRVDAGAMARASLVLVGGVLGLLPVPTPRETAPAWSKNAPAVS